MFRVSKKTFHNLLWGVAVAAWIRVGSATPVIDPDDDLPPREFIELQKLADGFNGFCNSLGGCTDIVSGERRHLIEDSFAHNILKAGKVQVGGRRLEFDCAAEVLACDLYLDNMFLPPIEDYTFQNVCIKESDDDFVDCKKDDVIKFTDKLDADADEFRYAGDDVPPQLRGVFSLEYSPCDWSSLVSFAQTREYQGDGMPFDLDQPGDFNGGIAAGFLGDGSVPQGPLRTGNEYVYAMRVLGDQNWAFATPYSIATFGTVLLDLVYKFALVEGTIENPKRFQIIPDIKIPFTCIRLEVGGCLEDLLRFDMVLIEDCNDIDDDLEVKALCDDGVVIWQRESWFGGYDEGNPSDTYYVVQVVDGNGDKIDDAWEFFLDNQQDCTDGTNEFPPQRYRNAYGRLNGKGNYDNSGFCHCAYTGDFPYGLDNLSPFDIEAPSSKKRGRRRRGLGENEAIETTKNVSKRRGGEENARRKMQKSPFPSCPTYTRPPSTPLPTPGPTPAPTKAPKAKRHRG